MPASDALTTDVAPAFPSRANPRLIAGFFTVTVFVNAVLLFSVEPMFAKIVLPFLGGTPSVWNTCLVFFQAALLAGYAYAHLLARLAPGRRRVLHMAILALSCLLLPLRISAHGDPPVGSLGIIWLLALLTTSLGAQFVMLASGAPMLQRWLADTGHPDAGSPYFLYAASNLGSLIALLSYPVLIEPWLTLSSQRVMWSVGYVILVLLMGACSLIIAREESPAHNAPLPGRTSAQPIAARQRLRWIIYSAVPSSLLVGATSYISTDVAAVPLLWVLPLSTYLLTFVIVFATRPWIPRSWMERAEPHVLVLIAIPIFWSLRLPGLIGIVAHLIVLFVVAMVCHGELARSRPPASQLTEFFVWISVGGLLGGVLTALVAPIVFNGIYEYPLALAVAGMLRPAKTADRGFRPGDLILPAVLGLCLVVATIRGGTPPDVVPLLVTMAFGTAVFSFRNRPMRFSLALAAVFIAGHLRASLAVGQTRVVDSERSFFGVYRVAREAGSPLIKLYHGTTLHGAQFVVPARRLTPLTYYHPAGPSGDIFGRTSAAMQPRRRIAVVGLGTGSLACYGHAGEQWTYFEIDPVVAEIAQNPRFFTFLRDCPPAVRIVLGDARLTLRKQGEARYDILALDAFSSDAIPVHLLTREAFQIYFRLLAPGGVIAVHISNQHLDIEPVVAAIANDIGAVARVRRDTLISESDQADGRSQAAWVILGRSVDDLGALAGDERWRALRRRTDVVAWTDDFSNIIRVFNWH
ncbi:MAG TPA: fused MFS/spermidine synthase [Gemmatimonadaceae bacterium]